jgi:uncharacterized protein YkwD
MNGYSKKKLTYPIVILAMVTLWGVCLGSDPFETNDTRNQYLTEVESIILKVTNAERARINQSLNPHTQPLIMLKAESDLQKIAREHASDMILRSFFDHTNPDGESFHDRISWKHRQAIISSTGENIWMQDKLDVGQAEKLAKQIVSNWMNSPEHRKNILSNRYTHLGVGVSCSQQTFTAVQDFAGITAYLCSPLPVCVKRGQTLRLDCLNKNLGILEKIDFWDPETERAVRNPIQNKSGKIKIPRGTYRYRFHFAGNKLKGWMIYQGPFVKVE